MTSVQVEPPATASVANGVTSMLTGNGTTTTLSTIAVRAEPHSTIVVAIVRSVGFVELRIDEMQPPLLHIGTTPSENAQLLHIHEDLYARLLSKQEQVEELLGRAEKLVTEQTVPDDILIYEAMADGLATAWKSLSRQLSMRGYILADTQHLYEIALKHEELSKLANSRLTKNEPPMDIIIMDELQRIIDELAELTREGLEMGTTVIAQIRILGALGDNDERPREVLTSCLAIEKIMLRIAHSWELIEGTWRNQREGSQQRQIQEAINDELLLLEDHSHADNYNDKEHGVAYHYCQQLYNNNDSGAKMENPAAKVATAAAHGTFVGANLVTAEQWLMTAAQRLDHARTNSGEDEELEMVILITDIKANYASLKGISEQIDPVLHANNATNCEQLLERYNRLLKEVQLRSDLLERTQAMIKKTDLLLVQLDKMQDDLRHASAAMAGELGPLAQQKGVALIEEGVQLSAQWEREPSGGRDTWGSAVDTRVDRLKEAVIIVVRMARDRIAQGKADKLREMLVSLETWLLSVAANATGQPITFNPSAAETAEFLNNLRRFSSDVTYKEQQLRSLVASQQKAQLFVPTEEERLDAVHAGISGVRQIVETRMQLGQTLEQLYKLSRELDTSLHFLGTLLRSDSAKNVVNGLDNECQKQFEQIRNLLQQANEHIYRERHQIDKFVSLANMAKGTDPSLNLCPVLDWSRSMLSIHEQELSRLTKLSKQWETERQNRQHLKMPSSANRITSFCPRFTEPLPSEHHAMIGTRLELSARAEGNPEPQVTWLKDANPIGELVGHRRMTWLNGLASLVIEELMDADAGTYCVVLANGQGEVSSRCKVNVTEEPSGFATFSNDEKMVGEVQKPLNKEQQATVVCTTTTVTQCETVEEKRLQQGGQDVQAVPVPAVGGVQKQQQQQQQQQIQQQPCKPHFVRQLENFNGRVGDPFVLDCVVVGNPEPKIIWYREEHTVQETDKIRLAFHGDHCTLNCTSASAEDAGLYKVLAMNVHGETVNFCRVSIVPPSPTNSNNNKSVPPPTAPKPATPILACRVEPEKETIQEIVTVQTHEIIMEVEKSVPPLIEPQLSSQLAREGQTVNFQVKITGIPAPEVRWFYDGKAINDVDEQLQQNLSISKGLAAENDHLLTIKKVTLSHSGHYAVEARNKVGQAHSSATLNVLLGFDETTNIKTTSITSPATTTPTSGFDSPQQLIIQQQHQQSIINSTPYPNNFASTGEATKMVFDDSDRQQQQQQAMFDQRSWSCQSFGSSPPGIVYTLSKSDRAESRRSSDFDEPGLGYSSLAKAPEFIRTLQLEVTINEGECAEVDCLMVGNPRPKIHWFFNDRLVKTSPRFFEFLNVGDTYTIRFASARLECAGYYRLCAENSRGRVEAQTLIHVRPRYLNQSMIPKPLQQRRSLGDARVGGMQALLRMQHERQWAQRKRALSTPPQQQQFLLLSMNGHQPSAATANTAMTNGPLYHQQQQQQQQQQKIRQILAPITTSSLTPAADVPTVSYGKLLDKMTSVNNTTAAETSYHQLMDSHQIRHRTPPQPKGSAPHFIQTLVSVVAPEGQNAKFEAVVTGTPQPRIEWSKNGELLVESDNVYFWAEAGRDYLVIEKTGANDVGKYCCTAENALGMASSSAQLLLRPKTIAPDFVQRLVSEELEEGMPMKWTVQISGDPTPTVKWLHDGKQIVEDGGPNSEWVHIVQDSFVHTLSIDAVKLSNAGQFTCVLENSAGEARSTADLVVRLKGTAPGKYVHVTKVTQERHQQGEEIAQRETIVVDDIEEEDDNDHDDDDKDINDKQTDH